jgi:hypothetical protein
MHERKLRARRLGGLVFITALAAIMAAGVVRAAAATAEAGACGEYRYWKDGKCVDARDEQTGAWSESMTKKPAW